MRKACLSWWALSSIFLFSIGCGPKTAQTPWDSLPHPGQNPFSEEGVELGKRLFEGQLQGKNGRSCISCHKPDSGFASYRPAAPNSDSARFFRQIPGLKNLAWSAALFWDGREQNLESLVLKPILNHAEMNLTLDFALGRLNQNPQLRQLNQKAFGTETMESRHLARALAQYLRTLVDTSVPYPLEGFPVSTFQARCAHCHKPPFYTDFAFHKSPHAANGPDSGRYHITHKPEDIYVFKTPSLLDLDKTAPYLHDGRLANWRSLTR